MVNPLISICIPAYKNEEYLQLLFNSIGIQCYTNFEVVVSDDSAGDEVEKLCQLFAEQFPIVYHKNFPALGSPANWNKSIQLAKGEWIKMMHDDDWFDNAGSLAVFAHAINQNPDAEFIFSGYAKYENGVKQNTHISSAGTIQKITQSPYCLVATNYIGHPSTTLIKNNNQDWYDENTKWVVDIEFYIRCLLKKRFFAIPEAQINIGINQHQITKAVFRDARIEVPENLYLLNKLGVGMLKNIIVYDYFWRVFRNLNIRSMQEVKKYAGVNSIPSQIQQMLRLQFLVPTFILKRGIFSKLLMSIAYTIN